MTPYKQENLKKLSSLAVGSRKEQEIETRSLSLSNLPGTLVCFVILIPVYWVPDSGSRSFLMPYFI